MASELFRIIGERKVYVVRDDKGQIVVSDELFNSLIDDFEKQIPKKPCRISEIDDNDNALVECPICHANSDYAINTIKSGYCWKCGQKLEW